jgi:ribonuclease HI
MIKVYVDGLCEPINPGGIATYGYVFKGDINGEWRGFVGQGKGMSNNVAEYAGLIQALQRLSRLNAYHKEIIVHSDSTLLVNQMSGKMRVRKGLYVPYYKMARNLSTTFSSLNFIHIPREQNTEADELSRDAYVEVRESRNIKPDFQVQTTRTDTGETCVNCRWMKVNGPHIGCYKNNEWQKWLSKEFASEDRCEFFVSKKIAR